MTPGLLKSAGNKSKLHSTYMYIENLILINKEQFTTYRNKLKTLKKKAEKDYYALEFMKHKDDLKLTWLTIKQILRTKNLILLLNF